MGKSKFIVSWILQIAVACLLGFFGYLKIISDPASVELFDTLGMGSTGLFLIGGLEILAAALLLIPHIIVYGALLSVSVMIGALIAHISVLGFDLAHTASLLFVLISSLIIMYIRRKRLPLIGSTFE